MQHTFDSKDGLPFAGLAFDALTERRHQLKFLIANFLFCILPGKNAYVQCQTCLSPLNAAALPIENFCDAVGQLHPPGICRHLSIIGTKHFVDGVDTGYLVSNSSNILI